MLDIVRIRRQGFPIHVPAEHFVQKYGYIARLMKKALSPDPKEATRQILTYVGAPTTEWQVGKTKVCSFWIVALIELIVLLGLFASHHQRSPRREDPRSAASICHHHSEGVQGIPPAKEYVYSLRNSALSLILSCRVQEDAQGHSEDPSCASQCQASHCLPQEAPCNHRVPGIHPRMGRP